MIEVVDQRRGGTVPALVASVRFAYQVPVHRLVLVYWIVYIARLSDVPALRAIHSPKFFAAMTEFT